MSGEATLPTPPREVRWASLALWIVATLYSVSALLTLFTQDTRAEQLRQSDTVLTDAQIEQAVRLGVGISLVFGLAIAAVAMAAAVNAPRGRRWARVAGTIVSGLAAAFSLLRIFVGGPTAAVSLVVLAASITAIVLLYRPRAAAFFARVSPAA